MTSTHTPPTGAPPHSPPTHTGHTSFAAEIAAEEESYAALMAQAKVSLARITELGVEIDKVRESQSSAGARTAGLLSEIGSFWNEVVESEDCVMGGSDQVGGTDQMEGGYYVGEDSMVGGTVEMEVDMDMEEKSFPELMERAKKLLARATTEGNDQKSEEAEAQARHDRAYADLWGPSKINLGYAEKAE